MASVHGDFFQFYNDRIDVSDLDLYDLIRALWCRSFLCDHWQRNDYPTTLPSDNDINRQISNSGYIDYLNGKVISTHFNDLKCVYTFFYNNNVNRFYAFEEVVENLREE